MPQTLFPKAYPEGITFVKTFTGTGCIHIGQLPGGGYSRVDGQPIQSQEELRAVIMPGKQLDDALEWWDRRNDEPEAEEPPAVTWRRGKLVYVDSGVELTSHAELIQAFPDESPMQRAALEWFGQRQAERHARHQNQELHNGLLGTREEPEPVEEYNLRRSHKKRTA